VRYLPFKLEGLISDGGYATYAPVKTIDGQTLQLRTDDHILFTFILTPNTVYCMGDMRVTDWSYLAKVGKKASVTVLTNDDTDRKALIIWDKGPSISVANNNFVFALPPMCK
jgi:hypothetical protein